MCFWAKVTIDLTARCTLFKCAPVHVLAQVNSVLVSDNVFEGTSSFGWLIPVVAGHYCGLEGCGGRIQKRTSTNCIKINWLAERRVLIVFAVRGGYV